MITLSKSGNTVTFTFDENSGYLQNGTIDVPVNSLSLILDESNMATFRKSASNDIFVSALVGDFGMSKSELEAWYKENMVGSTGGGGVTSGEVQTMIDEAVSGKQDTIVEGRAIDITNNTVSLDLPISAGTGTNSIREGHSGNTASGSYSVAEGYRTSATSESSHAEGSRTQAIGGYGAHAEGYETIASGNSSHAEGGLTVTNGHFSHAEGFGTLTNNLYEHASGQFNVSSSGSTTFGDSGNTLFSVGNGTNSNARHNAFEIRQNGDIYLSSGGTDILLQDHLGGGKAIEAGRGISITTGETADTVSFNLPISAGTGVNSIKCGGNCVASGNRSAAFGNNASSKGQQSFAINQSTANGQDSFSQGTSYAEKSSSAAFGRNNYSKNDCELSCGQYNNSVSASTTFGNSGNTLFSVGNGTSTSARHNAFEIRQNGDIYLSLNGQDVKLQDQLGGGTVDQTIISGSTNAVAGGAVYDKFDEVEQVTAAALNNINDRLSEDEEVTAAGLNAVNDKFDGLKLKKLTQAEYDALTTKDAQTLYIIVN